MYNMVNINKESNPNKTRKIFIIKTDSKNYTLQKKKKKTLSEFESKKGGDTGQIPIRVLPLRNKDNVTKLRDRKYKQRNNFKNIETNVTETRTYNGQVISRLVELVSTKLKGRTLKVVWTVNSA